MGILLINGALRKESLNRKLLVQAAKSYGDDAPVWADLNMPLYDGDLEAESGLPEQVIRLEKQITAADAVIIASPEYNQNISGVLKNALDWVSRLQNVPLAGKPVALVHATAGRTGGARANYALRLAIAPFDVHLIGTPEVLVASAHNAFDDSGTLKDERYQRAVDSLMQHLRNAAA